MTLKKQLKLPQIKVSNFDRLWLSKLYEKILEGEKPTYKTIRKELQKELPVNFRPANIDSMLVSSDGESITFFGVQTVDPKNKIIEEADKIILYIKKLTVDKPEIKHEFTSEQISEATTLSLIKVQFLLDLIWRYTRFFQSGSRHTDMYGYSQIEMNGGHDSFTSLLYFESLVPLIESYYEEEQEIRNKQLQIVKPKEVSITQPLLQIASHSVFKSTITEIDKKLCFVLMPFKMTWSNSVYKNIRNCVELLGLQCLRADNLKGPIIIEDIWIKINQAGLIIADVTGKNPNVMYELGIAHTLNKPVILLTQSVEESPFDFAHLRHFVYSNAIDGADFFTNELKEIVREIYSQQYTETLLTN